MRVVVVMETGRSLLSGVEVYGADWALLYSST